MIAGGCEELDPDLSVLFDAMGAMSSRYNETPAQTPKAFDKNRDGFVIAGGAGILVLEERERALARGARIYAELVGYGLSSDGYDMVQPSGDGAVRSMRMAMRGLHGKALGSIYGGVGTVDYINAHGTGTPIGDQKEIAAIREVFGERRPPTSSTKSLVGHSLGAAGASEAIFSILAIDKGFIPGSANIDELDPEFADANIIRTSRHAEVDLVMSNSFGFGGTNCTLVLGAHD